MYRQFFYDDIEFLSKRNQELELPVTRPLQVSQWARRRQLDEVLTEKPGMWDNAFVPYLVEIMDCFSADSSVKEVALMKPGQIGASTGILENWIGYIIDENPGPTLYLSGSDKLAKTGAEVKIDRLIEDAGLTDKIKSPIKRKSKGRKSGDTAVRKDFPRGFVMILGAQSTSNLKQISVQNLIFDETDEIPLFLKNQGDPITLAKVRQKTFDLTRKTLYLSTPTTFAGPIYQIYLRGDRRWFYVPCPYCGFEQTMTFRGTRKDEKKYGIYYEVDSDFNLIYESVHYICENCLKFWSESEKKMITNAGYWKPTHTSINRYLRSYWLESLYSQFTRWTSVVEEWLLCWSEREKRVVSVEKLKVFQNTQRGLPFEDRYESPDFEEVIKNRRHNYTRNQILNTVIIQETGSPVLCLTAGVDPHKDWIGIEIKAWCADRISYSIDYRKLPGPVTNLSGKSWTALEEILSESWIADDGRGYAINLMLIDASYETGFVYDFCRKYDNVYAIQGRHAPPGNARMREFDSYDRKGLVAYNITVTLYKNNLAGWIRHDWQTDSLQPTGYCNFPSDYGDDFFREYEAEHKVKVSYKNGKSYYIWKKKEEHLANHTWDCGVYNCAAIDMLCYLTNFHELGTDAINYKQFWDYIAENKIFYFD